jgi:hypothetical protein
MGPFIRPDAPWRETVADKPGAELTPEAIRSAMHSLWNETHMPIGPQPVPATGYLRRAHLMFTDRSGTVEWDIE